MSNPMSRFALFVTALIVIVAIGAQSQPQPRHGSSLNKSIKSMCVCIPARAGLIMKAAIAKTQARSAELLTVSQ